MKIAEFWTQAYLAALTRLPAELASREADLATEQCIKRWQLKTYRWNANYAVDWQNACIFSLPATDAGKVVEGFPQNNT